MSECVVRMEMPKNNCEMAVEIKGAGDWCPIAARVCDYYSTKKMPDWCPIICQLPEEHGRLGDLDAMVDDVKNLWDYATVDGITSSTVLKQVMTDIGNAPTIVPADMAERSET